jgi:hypothetical protein
VKNGEDLELEGWRGMERTARVRPWEPLGWSFLSLYSSWLNRRTNFRDVLILFLLLSGFHL